MVATNFKSSPYCRLMEQNTNYRNKLDNLQFNLKTLFGDLEFKGKFFLDIGGGNGIFSFYAAYMGAEKVVCLEPESDGSNSGMNTQFRKLLSESRLTNVRLIKETIQSYQPEAEKYDIILLNNSINHLDESACEKIHCSTSAYRAYVDIFRKIESIASEHARLFICDCSRYNLFPLLKIRNPFTPAIEWHKHQSPEVWGGILSDAGFVVRDISWNAFHSLGTPGRLLLGNKYGSFLLGSRFTLRAEKAGRSW